MLPDVEAYLKACETNEKLITEAQDKALADFRESRGTVRWTSRVYDDMRYAMQRAAENVMITSESEAWEKLTKSEDRLVNYIANNYYGYKTQALEVLKILPATRAQLEDLAVEHEWCGDWDRFVDRAERLGYVEPESEITNSQATRELVDWFENCINSSTRNKRRMLMLVGKVVEEALANQKVSDTVTEATEVETS